MITIKSELEIVKMREAGRIVAEVHQLMREMIKPGITTAELDQAAAKHIASRNAQPSFLGYHGFPATICASLNEEVVHGFPSERQLQVGDILSVDVGAIYQGFHGDGAITVAVGEIEPETQRLLDVTEEALRLGIAAALSGNRVRDISQAVQEYVEAAGFSVVRTLTGHGIGTEMHEDPEVPNFVSSFRGAKLVPGMVIAIEPMVNRGTFQVKTLADGWTIVTTDGMPSAHFEHTVAITEDGPVILTTI